jgi:hypothetical protein
MPETKQDTCHSAFRPDAAPLRQTVRARIGAATGGRRKVPQKVMGHSQACRQYPIHWEIRFFPANIFCTTSIRHVRPSYQPSFRVESPTASALMQVDEKSVAQRDQERCQPLGNRKCTSPLPRNGREFFAVFCKVRVCTDKLIALESSMQREKGDVQ